MLEPGKIKVLIADSSSVVRDGLRSILLSDPDIEVVEEAASGLEALGEAGRLHPSVILIDAQMRDMSGTEVTRRIKEQQPNIKILVLTVHQSYTEPVLAAGADACLMKDSTSQELLEAIKQLGRQV